MIVRNKMHAINSVVRQTERGQAQRDVSNNEITLSYRNGHFK